MNQNVTSRYGWGATSDKNSKSGISLQRDQFDPKFPVEGVAPINHSSCHETRVNDLSYGIKIWTDHSSVLSQYTRLTDRQINGGTDGQTESPSLDPVCIPRSPVKQHHQSLFTLLKPTYGICKCTCKHKPEDKYRSMTTSISCGLIHSRIIVSRPITVGFT